MASYIKLVFHSSNVEMAALCADVTSTLLTFSKLVNLEMVQDEERCPRFVNTVLNSGADKKRGISSLMSDHSLLKKRFAAPSWLASFYIIF